MAEWIGGRWAKWRGGIDHSTIVCFSLFVSIYISNYNVKVARDYPNREVLCIMNGFKSHHNFIEALKIVADNNIRAVKEEGGEKS